MPGSRIDLPPDALRCCASCGRQRRNRTVGWSAITRQGTLAGWTCPDCPEYDEPIRRTADGKKFVAVVSVTESGQRRQYKRTLPDLAAARAWVAETRKGTTSTARADDMTVAELATKWLDRRTADRDNGRIRTGTIDGYRSALSAVLARIGRRRIRDLDEATVERLAFQMASAGNPAGWDRPLSHRSIRYSLGTLRQILEWAVRQGWLPSNPAAAVTAPTRPNPRKVDRWNTTELVQFRERADLDPHVEIRAGMRLTLCGLRRSEVLGLHWERVDLETGTIVVAASRTRADEGGPKTVRSYRRVAADTIHPGTAQMLRDLWVAQGQPERGHVITRDHGAGRQGTPIRPDAYTAAFRRICGQAGVRPLTSIHNVRHTVATALKEAGVADHQAAALFGHDVATYRRYYLVTDDEAADVAAEAAGRLFVNAPLTGDDTHDDL